MSVSPLTETIRRMSAIIKTHAHVPSSAATNIASELLETLAVKGYLTDIDAQRPRRAVMEKTMSRTLSLAGCDRRTRGIIVPKLYDVLKDMDKA